MPRYVLTGTPGSGKTAILRLLELAGYAVVEEAATDVIALEQARGQVRPEEWPGFLPAITALQRQRQERLAPPWCGTVFFDRSPVCTLALARFLGKPVPAALTAELDRIAAGAVYALILLLIMTIVQKGFHYDSRTVTLIVLALSGGGLGGVIGINVRK